MAQIGDVFALVSRRNTVVELRSHPAIVLFAPSGYDTVGDIKAEISCLHVAAPPPGGFEVVLAIIEADAESGLQLIACLLEGMSHF